ncbi:hypothetical protein HII31_10895 [Pseudocercospora fuligena]|uniref:DUF6536 domain-containing protein n=1 Tax=Pseudocercospora fuligena TaxID=685502 RepID=A0A8H6RB88_9PEZI|nr:hypothetical protein HII31_10895 [Pseudocercospora fuligena]
MDRHRGRLHSNLSDELSVSRPHFADSVTTSDDFNSKTASSNRQQPEPTPPRIAGTESCANSTDRESNCDERNINRNDQYQNVRTELLELYSQRRVSRKRRRMRQGWRHGLKWATISTCIILFVNALRTIVAAICLHGKSDGGVVPLYTGTRKAVSVRATSVHLLINALSALLFSGANYSMQCLAAPTRSELDRAHRRHRRLDVGVPSARNLFGGISWKRSIVWIILLLSSLPIHTFYNAVIFATLNDNSFDVWLVNESFFGQNVTSNELHTWALHAELQHISPYTYEPSDAQTCVREVQHVHATFAKSTSDRPEQIQRLEVQECEDAYKVEDAILFSDRSTLVLVTSEKGPYGNRSLISFASDGNFTRSSPFHDGRFRGHQVDYCLSQITKRSTLQFCFQLAGLVITCNLTIALAMLWLLHGLNAEPLITVGDALTSFLDERDGELSSLNNSTPIKSKAKCYRRATHTAISHTRWIIGLALIVFCFLTAGAFAGTGLWYDFNGNLAFGLDDLSAGSFGSYYQIVAYAFQGGSWPPGLLASVLAANLPQLLCSLFYFVYDGLLSTLLLAREWNRFYLRRRTLRVSDPKGQQRSTFYLEVPFRYGIPLVLCSVALHWFVSQSIFVIFITTWNSSGEKVDIYSDIEAVTTSTTGSPRLFFSRLGLLLAAILSFLMIVALVWFGYTKLPGGMPIVGSNSRLIAAACHRPDDDEDAAYLPISWGELVHDNGKGPGHCCFTSKEVQAPPWVRENTNASKSKHQPEGWMLRKCRSVFESFSHLTKSTPGLGNIVRRRAQKREMEQQAVWLYAGT